MKYGIISDIHSNLEALEAVLKELSREGVDRYLCMGDIVGYGANPKECIGLVRGLNPVIVAGNHDWGCIGRVDLEYFNRSAKDAIIWTQGILNDEEKSFLSSLELVHEDEHITLVHGTLYEPEKFHYLVNIRSAGKTIELLKTSNCFVGHTHIPVVFSNEEGSIKAFLNTEIEFIAGAKQAINVGSVGQPRDGNPQAAYGVYHLERNLIEFKRVKYDIQAAQEKILKAGLPESLAARLSQGI